jgi:hypothetical protein
VNADPAVPQPQPRPRKLAPWSQRWLGKGLQAQLYERLDRDAKTAFRKKFQRKRARSRQIRLAVLDAIRAKQRAKYHRYMSKPGNKERRNARAKRNRDAQRAAGTLPPRPPKTPRGNWSPERLERSRRRDREYQRRKRAERRAAGTPHPNSGRMSPARRLRKNEQMRDVKRLAYARSKLVNWVLTGGGDVHRWTPLQLRVLGFKRKPDWQQAKDYLLLQLGIVTVEKTDPETGRQVVEIILPASST